MIIGERIKQVINQSNMEVNRVAIALDMSPQNLYKIFKKDSCESKYLEKLSELTNTPIKYFFGDKWDNALVNQSENRNKSDINQRLIQVHNAVISQRFVKNSTEFFNAIGISLKQGVDSPELKNNKHFVTPTMCAQLERLFGVNSKWLLTGQGQMFKADYPVNNTSNEAIRKDTVPDKVNEPSLIPVPFVPLTARNIAFLETFLTRNMADRDFETRYYYAENPLDFQGALAFETDGGMEPTLERGDTVVATAVEKSDWEYVQGGLYAVVFRDFFVIKRIVTNDLVLNSVLTLQSDNPQSGNIHVRYEDIKAIWKVRLIYRVIN
jgi:phage repressor protein C with HTH and peptisase S24 domain